LAEAWPDVAHNTAAEHRQMSAQSYWNLRTGAALQGWSAAEVLNLIEEHLSPTRDREAIHQNETASGDDWCRLYESIHKSG
jgi:hypothetical protein